jgi:lysophospholipase L1-like esterase
MSTATETLYTDPSFTFSGSWGTNSNAAWNGGAAAVSSVIGDQVTINWTGHSLYLLGAKFSTGVDFTVQTDGVPRLTNQTMFSSNPKTVYRYPIKLESGLTDGAHTTVLKSIVTSTFNQYMINGIIAVSGTPAAPTANVYDACGDSWTTGQGALVLDAGYAYQVRRRIGLALGTDLTFHNNGFSGSALANKDAQNSTNAIEQIITAAGHQPQYLSLMFGINDLGNSEGYNLQSPGMFAELWRTTLQFVQEMFNTSSTIIVAGTPGNISPAYRWTLKQNAGTLILGFAGGLDAYEMGVNAARSVFSEFSWLRVADVYAAMDRRTALNYPNSSGDLGLHPNESGHQVVADEFAHAFLAPAA